MARLPFTARRREVGSKLSKIQELFLNTLLLFFMPRAAEQKQLLHRRTFGVIRLLRGSVHVRGGGGARRLRRERFDCETPSSGSKNIFKNFATTLRLCRLPLVGEGLDLDDFLVDCDPEASLAVSNIKENQESASFPQEFWLRHEGAHLY